MIKEQIIILVDPTGHHIKQIICSKSTAEDVKTFTDTGWIIRNIITK